MRFSLPSLTRRGFLGVAGLAGLSLPVRLGAAAPTHRRFLFVYVNGGWDPTFVFAPMFDSALVDMPENSQLATIGGLPLVDSPDRPFTRTFFQNWGSASCVINGMQVASITHDRCRRILMTGGPAAPSDDWPSILAAETGGNLRLPCVVASGPAYTSAHSASVVRLGPNGQLSALLDGSALTAVDRPVTPPPDAVQAAVDAHLATRLAARAGTDAVGVFSSSYLATLENRLVVAEGLATLELEDSGGPLTPLSLRAAPLLTCFENDLSRCAMIEHAGLFARRWDSHSDIEGQTGHYEDLFESLDALMIALEARSGPAGGSLLDETTVVVVSEMGRTPQRNAGGGKDHWTWTSAMLLGAGIAGGQVIGGFDEGLTGTPIDLDTGEPGDTYLSAAHLGATLLELAGVETSVAPVRAALG